MEVCESSVGAKEQLNTCAVQQQLGTSAAQKSLVPAAIQERPSTSGLQEKPGTISNKCAVCSANSPKYKCPRCLVKTCSLPCVKKHKADQDCDGVREKTAYISLKNFKDLNLLNDYRFLEDAGRKAESVHRDPENRRYHIPIRLQKLIAACRKRDVDFKYMPQSFSKRKENRSYYNIAQDEIDWHVEWIFPQAGIKHSEKISENRPLQEVIKSYFDPAVASAALYHSLKDYRKEHEEKGMSLFMKVEGRPANSVRYNKFEPEANLSTCLKGTRIIEYPSIYVVLGKAAKEYRLLNVESDSSSSEDSSTDSEDSDSESETSSSSDSELENMEATTKSSTAEPPWNKLLDPNFGSGSQ